MANTPKTFKTDTQLRVLIPASNGRTYDVSDAFTRGLKIRIGSETTRGPKVRIGKATYGHFARSWVFVGRFPGSSNPTRVKLGEYFDGADEQHGTIADRRRRELLTLEEAREIAGEWRRLILKGIDPRQADRDRKAAAERAKTLKEATFGKLAEDYIKAELLKQRKGDVAERVIRRELMGQPDKKGKAVGNATWSERSAASITQEDIEHLIDAVKARGSGRNKGVGSYARNVLQFVRSIFKWGTATIARRARYGLDRSPCAPIKPKDLLGKKRSRKRVLNMRELRGLWTAAGTLGYPYGPLIQLDMLTAGRRSEVGEAQWPEFDSQLVELLRKGEPIDWRQVPDDIKLWTVPPERFKQDDVHIIPLSNAACAVLATLPHFAGDCLFSTTGGSVPVDGYSNAKERIDRALLDVLGYEPTPWVFHDIRRSVRTGLGALGVPKEIAELAIGHAREGIEGVYDRHGYLAERRKAFKQWSVKLLGPDGGDAPTRKVWNRSHNKVQRVAAIKRVNNVVKLRA